MIELNPYKLIKTPPLTKKYPKQFKDVRIQQFLWNCQSHDFQEMDNDTLYRVGFKQTDLAGNINSSLFYVYIDKKIVLIPFCYFVNEKLRSKGSNVMNFILENGLKEKNIVYILNKQYQLKDYKLEGLIHLILFQCRYYNFEKQIMKELIQTENKTKRDLYGNILKYEDEKYRQGTLLLPSSNRN